MPTGSKKHTGFWSNVGEHPWGAKKIANSWAFFDSVVVCSGSSYNLSHQGLPGFCPSHYFPEGTNIIKPAELGKLWPTEQV